MSRNLNVRITVIPRKNHEAVTNRWGTDVIPRSQARPFGRGASEGARVRRIFAKGHPRASRSRSELCLQGRNVQADRVRRGASRLVPGLRREGFGGREADRRFVTYGD